MITGIHGNQNVKGNILWGILITWLLGIICQFTGLYANPDVSCYSYCQISATDFLSQVLHPILATQFDGIFTLDFAVVVFAFLFVDMFDTIGTLIGVSSKANMLDEEGKLPQIKGALLADAIATTAGAVLGTSTTTTFVESASGVTEGGRTGLTAVTTAILFQLCTVPVTNFHTIIICGTNSDVGWITPLTNVVCESFNDIAEAIPCCYLYSGENTVLLRHFKKCLYRSYLICSIESDYRKGKR